MWEDVGRNGKTAAVLSVPKWSCPLKSQQCLILCTLSTTLLQAVDDAKIRGNRQIAAAVFETIVRNKQQCEDELYALEKVKAVLLLLVRPTPRPPRPPKSLSRRPPCLYRPP